jgi:adenosylhomocysteine nucleosidase
MKLAVASLVLAGCMHPAPKAPTTPGPVVALISASAEWKIIRAQLTEPVQHDTPYGEWLVHRLGGRNVIFFHGGYAKVSAAGSTQYAIDRWHPALVVNLGTCGGFGGERKVGDIIVASETLIYDIIERMGDPAEAIEDFHTRLPPVWPARLADRVIAAPLVSADADLDPAAVAGLAAKYHASVADWESGAIAWVATHNHTPVIILRGVTDVIDPAGRDATYGAIGNWEQASIAVMATLVSLLGEALSELLPDRAK